MFRFTSLATFCATLTALTPAQIPESTTMGDRIAAAMERVIFDRPGDGALWAATTAYKARFASDGTMFFGFFGTDAPTAPIRFKLSDLRVGDRRVEFAADAQPTRHGTRVAFERGAVTEFYELGSNRMEQLFEFTSLDRRGAIVVRIAVDSELRPQPGASAGDDTLCFVGEHGRVEYSQPFAFDATGRRIALDHRWVEDTIEIRVPAAFVEAAILPLTIDPLIGSNETVIHADFTNTLKSPDLAFEAASGRWLCCWELVRSPTDSDVFALELDDALNPIGTPVAIDVTTAQWTVPRIASNGAAQRFLVVCERGGAVWGRTRDAGATTMGRQFAIADATVTGHAPHPKRRPDVGGDPNAQTAGDFTVVWKTEDVSGGFDEIHVKQVTNAVDPVLRQTAPLVVDRATRDLGVGFGRPAISNSNGLPPAADQRWFITYEFNGNVRRAWQLRGSTITKGGTVDTPFVVSNAPPPEYDNEPAVSSPTGDPASNRYAMFAWSDHDVHVRILDYSGAALTPATNMSLLEEQAGRPQSQPNWRASFQGVPSVDASGCRFAVAYEDNWDDLRVDTRIALCQYDPAAGAVVLNEAGLPAGFDPEREQAVAIYAQKSGGGTPGLYAASWAHVPIIGTAGLIEVQGYIGASAAWTFERRATRCSAPSFQLVVDGSPILGEPLTFRTIGGGSALLTRITVGFLRSIPFPDCSCLLGVDGPFLGDPSTLVVPCATALAGARLAAQGLQLRPPGQGACLGGQFDLTDTLTFRVR